MIRAAEFRWEGVPVLPYKETGTHFKSISRQTLFGGGHDLPVELRYFEMAADGHSTLERHQHAHLVMIIRGSGHVFVCDRIHAIAQHDIVQIPPMTWHQFRPDNPDGLGFLCVVSVERDRPQRPDESQVAELSRDPNIGAFIRV